MIREILEEINEGMDDGKFVNAMVDLATDLDIDYNNKSTKDIIGDLVLEIGKNKKQLYNYWSKNRGKELYNKLEKAFD